MNKRDNVGKKEEKVIQIIEERELIILKVLINVIN